ncbi:MAG: copper amine oxidase N-terminal domain-containing protein [Clostridiales bacterium]|nr:copper amine oxidase N-terminal domain-containing protein [Clostridiales bacterium]
MKKIIFMLSLMIITVCFGANVYAMTGLNVSMTAPSSAKPGETVSVIVTAEIPGGQDVQGIQVDFGYSEGFPEINKNDCKITKDTSGWSLVGITGANLLTVGNRLESDAVVEGELVFTIPEENALSEYTVSIESAIAAVNGEAVDFNVETESVEINVEGGSSSASSEKETETTTAEGAAEADNSSSGSSDSGSSGSGSYSSYKKDTAETAETEETEETEETSETAEASEETESLSSEIIMKIGSKDMTVFGKELTNDVPPIIVNSRTMLPLSFISECMGAQVDWNADLKEITIIRGEAEIRLAIGSAEIQINGTQSEIDTAPFIQNSRTYVPIRFISEAMGLNVDWIETEKTVTISKD